MAVSQITTRFGASVRKLRHRLGMSQEALAEHADLHRTYITGIECGARNVTLKSIDKLARALQVSTATLLSLSSEPGDGTGLRGNESPVGQCVDILMVEDCRADVELTLRAFKQARISNSVKVVRDGEEALNFVFCTGRFAQRKLEDRPQLVLLDLNLPKLGGKEVLRRMKVDERTRSIPVVVLTGSRDGQELAECRRLGAEAFIIKPVDFHSLSQATPRLKLNWALLEPSEAASRNLRAGAAG
jgi:CheY-like chemotaxis protein/DNA-binding XRE family transcriptional regulator